MNTKEISERISIKVQTSIRRCSYISQNTIHGLANVSQKHHLVSSSLLTRCYSNIHITLNICKLSLWEGTLRLGCLKYQRVNFLINVLHLLPSDTIYPFRSLQRKLRSHEKSRLSCYNKTILNHMRVSNEIK